MAPGRGWFAANRSLAPKQQVEHATRTGDQPQNATQNKTTHQRAAHITHTHTHSLSLTHHSPCHITAPVVALLLLLHRLNVCQPLVRQPQHLLQPALLATQPVLLTTALVNEGPRLVGRPKAGVWEGEPVGAGALEVGVVVFEVILPALLQVEAVEQVVGVVGERADLTVDVVAHRDGRLDDLGGRGRPAQTQTQIGRQQTGIGVLLASLSLSLVCMCVACLRVGRRVCLVRVAVVAVVVGGGRLHLGDLYGLLCLCLRLRLSLLLWGRLHPSPSLHLPPSLSLSHQAVAILGWAPLGADAAMFAGCGEGVVGPIVKIVLTVVTHRLPLSPRRQAVVTPRKQTAPAVLVLMLMLMLATVAMVPAVVSGAQSHVDVCVSVLPHADPPDSGTKRPARREGGVVRVVDLDAFGHLTCWGEVGDDGSGGRGCLVVAEVVWAG